MTVTETRAAHEAATIEAMHTGDYSAPDLEYTPIVDKLPELVRPAEVAALRQRVVELEAALNDAQLQITRERNNCAWIGARSGEQATRVAELETLERRVHDAYTAYCRLAGAHGVASLPFSRWLDAMCIVTTVRP